MTNEFYAQNGLFRKLIRLSAYLIALILAESLATYLDRFDWRSTTFCLFVLFGMLIELLSDRVRMSIRYGVYLLVVVGIFAAGIMLVGKAQDYKKCCNGDNHGSCNR